MQFQTDSKKTGKSGYKKQNTFFYKLVPLQPEKSV